MTVEVVETSFPFLSFLSVFFSYSPENVKMGNVPGRFKQVG